MSHDTIYALASAAGRGGVAVFRVSGPLALQAVRQLAGRQDITPRQAVLCTLKNGQQKIDQALALYFPAPHSFTGEDVVEFHTHGGRAVTQALLEALQNIASFRLAEAGEFTRRAFENGKLDLTEAEAIADLVDAETQAQHQQALRQMEGALGKIYHGWADEIIKMLAHLEAYLDFPDEALPETLASAHKQKLQQLEKEISVHLADSHRGERLRDGIRVAIIGAPNVGKSSLLNILAAREAAIVSPTAGTTRDVIEVSLNIGGYPVVLQDTAGIRETDDAIEQEGVKRARALSENADIKIMLFDSADMAFEYNDDKSILVLNKADLPENAQHKDKRLLKISASSGYGIADLKQKLLEKIEKYYAVGTVPSLTRTRHRLALEQALQDIKQAQTAVSLELVAEDLRMAVRHIGAITGKVDVEQLLDIIFRDFCIGK